MSDFDDSKFVILGQDEPDLDKMQKNIMNLLETGKSVNDIAISLKMDPETIQGYADRFNRDRWQGLSRMEIRKEHVSMLNEMAELGKLQYMADPKPPNGFAVASIIKTVNEVLRDMDSSDTLGDVKDRIQNEVVHAILEQLVIAMTREIGQTRKLLVEMSSPDRRNEISRLTDDVAKSFALHAKAAFEEATRRVDVIFEDNANKSKTGGHKKQTNTGIVNLVPYADPTK